jgi:hypothetical protein
MVSHLRAADRSDSPRRQQDRRLGPHRGFLSERDQRILTSRLSDAGPRRDPAKLISPDYRLPPWLTEDAPRDRSNRLLDLITEAFPPAVVAETNSVDVKAWAVIVLVIAQFWALPESWQFLETNNFAKCGRPRPIRSNKKYLLVPRLQRVQVIEQVDVCHGV